MNVRKKVKERRRGSVVRVKFTCQCAGSCCTRIAVCDGNSHAENIAPFTTLRFKEAGALSFFYWSKGISSHNVPLSWNLNYKLNLRACPSNG